MMNKKGQLIVYSGPSGVGKGTILKPLLEGDNNLVLSVSATTRNPRPGEVDGREYHFVSRERFEQLIAEGDMLEYAEYSGNYYGTPKSFVEQQREKGCNVILEIETAGAKQIKALCPDAVMIFIMPPSYEELKARLVGRGTETAEQCAARLEKAVEEMKRASLYDFVIVNDNLEHARAELLKAVQAGQLLTRHNSDFIRSVVSKAEIL